MIRAFPERVLATLMALLVPIVGLLMVSNVKYRSFKDLNVKGRVPFVVFLIAVLVFSVCCA